VVNVYDNRLAHNSSEMVDRDRPGVVMDGDSSLQSTATAATENGPPRAFTDKPRRTNGIHPTAPNSSSKGSVS